MLSQCNCVPLIFFVFLVSIAQATNWGSWVDAVYFNIRFVNGSMNRLTLIGSKVVNNLTLLIAKNCSRYFRTDFVYMFFQC